MSSIWRPFTQMQTASLPFNVTKTKGSYLYLDNGKKIIDAISSWWLITHGHCEDEIVQAIQTQAEQMDQILFANFTHQTAQDLVTELLEFFPPHLKRVFFSDNGSTSVEVALKMAMQSWSQKGHPEKTKFLSFTHSYHGDTVGAMSVSAPSIFTKAYKPFLFSIEYAKQGALSTDEEKVFYEDFEKKLEAHHKTTAAVIIEPLVQGAGGMIVWPEKALEKVCQLTKEAGLYLIFDEVMTGFGRTGTWFAFDQIQTKPDIVCVSKGLTAGFLPMALTIASEDIYQDFLSNKKERALLHGHSFTGNPLSCAAALANVRLIKKNKTQLEKKLQTIESINKSRAEKLRNNPEVKDVRYKGVIAAVQKENDEGYASSLSEAWAKKAMEQDIFLRPLGDTIYILPPYCISEQELHKVWDLIESLF